MHIIVVVAKRCVLAKSRARRNQDRHALQGSRSTRSDRALFMYSAGSLRQRHALRVGAAATPAVLLHADGSRSYSPVLHTSLECRFSSNETSIPLQPQWHLKQHWSSQTRCMSNIRDPRHWPGLKQLNLGISSHGTLNGLSVRM